MFSPSRHILACFTTIKPVSDIFTVLHCWSIQSWSCQHLPFFALWKIFYSLLVLVIVVPVKLKHFVFFRSYVVLISHTMLQVRCLIDTTYQISVLTLFSVPLIMTHASFSSYSYLQEYLQFSDVFTGILNSSWQNNSNIKKATQYWWTAEMYMTGKSAEKQLIPHVSWGQFWL